MSVPIVTYETVKDLPNHPEILLVDVREVQEIKDSGAIPTSINVPRELTSSSNFPMCSFYPFNKFHVFFCS